MQDGTLMETTNYFGWRLVVDAGIDGYSRLIVFMQCSKNNKANTVAECFIAAVRQFGWPSRTRTDYGKKKRGSRKING